MVKKLVTLTHSETLAYLSVKWVDFISQFISVQCNLIRCNSIHHRMLSYSFAWNLKFYLQVISTPPDLHKSARILSVQFSSVAQWCPTLCSPMNRSTPGLPVHHQLPEFTQTHLHWVSDAIQPSHSLSSPSPPAPNPSQHQSLFQWVNSSHEVAKVLEFQL